MLKLASGPFSRSEISALMLALVLASLAENQALGCALS